MRESSQQTAAGDKPAAVRVLLTPRVLTELRLALLGYGSPLSFSLELVEERYDNGDVVVRLGQPDKRERGERILGARKAARRDEQLAA